MPSRPEFATPEAVRKNSLVVSLSYATYSTPLLLTARRFSKFHFLFLYFPWLVVLRPSFIHPLEYLRNSPSFLSRWCSCIYLYIDLGCCCKCVERIDPPPPTLFSFSSSNTPPPSPPTCMFALCVFSFCSGHYNHCLFWNTLCNHESSGSPSPKVLIAAVLSDTLLISINTCAEDKE